MMEALDAGKKIVKSLQEEDNCILKNDYLNIGNKFLDEGYEVGSLCITPRERNSAGMKGMFYVWNPDTREGKFFLLFPENDIEDIEPFHEMTGTKEEIEDKERILRRYDELYFYNGDEADEMLREEEERKEKIKKEIEESASAFKVYGGR